MLYLAILLMFVFFAGVAMTIGEGLWSNTILLFLVIICGLLAFVGGVPLAGFVIEQAEPSNEYVWHFVMACVWGSVLSLDDDHADATGARIAHPSEIRRAFGDGSRASGGTVCSSDVHQFRGLHASTDSYSGRRMVGLRCSRVGSPVLHLYTGTLLQRDECFHGVGRHQL